MSAAINAKTAKQRANIAAIMLKRNKNFTRAFDDCFEMGDGDEVMNILIEKTAKDPVLARNIKSKMPKLGYGDYNTRLHQAIELALQAESSIPYHGHITGNDILFTCKPNLGINMSLSLHKQSYSDGTCFYTLQDRWGNWEVNRASRNILDLIKQVKREIEIESSVRKRDSYKANPEIRAIYDEAIRWKEEILANLIALNSKEGQPCPANPATNTAATA